MVSLQCKYKGIVLFASDPYILSVELLHGFNELSAQLANDNFVDKDHVTNHIEFDGITVVTKFGNICKN